MTNSKDVVVTGVSTGIGWGTTKVLVSKGFRVFGSVCRRGYSGRRDFQPEVQRPKQIRESVRRNRRRQFASHGTIHADGCGPDHLPRYP